MLYFVHCVKLTVPVFDYIVILLYNIFSSSPIVLAHANTITRQYKPGGSTMSNTDSNQGIIPVHKEGSGQWWMHYFRETNRDRKGYVAALVAYRQFQETPEDLFGATEMPSGQIHLELQQRLLEAALKFASTLYSAINFFARPMPRWRKSLIGELDSVVQEIEKLLGQGSLLTSSQKEPLVAIYMLLAVKYPDERGYRYLMAVQLGREVLADDHAGEVTRLLVCARFSLLDLFSEEERQMYRNGVLQYLEANKNSVDLDQIEQGWKTYVRLTRMVYTWGYMFHGLWRDVFSCEGFSPDLTGKSLGFFLLFFWKNWKWLKQLKS